MIGRFFRSGFGILFLAILVLLGGFGGIVGYQIHSVTHPVRIKEPIHPDDFLMRSDDVTFQSPDGVSLSGWLIHGDRRAPAILLCHDLGDSKSAFLSASVPLQRAGFNLLAFDFRGHGDSGGNASTLGTEERYDVLGAVDFLRTRRDLSSDRIGVWGIGMGAYAATLAAPERREMAALVLDSLYPDIPAFLDRVLFKGVPEAASGVTHGASFFYGPFFRWKASRGAVARILPQISDRNFLFVVGTSRPESVEAGKELYSLLPEGGASDRNFLELERSGVSGNYAEDRKKYEEAISGFFRAYLTVPPEKSVEKIRLAPR